MEELLNEIKNPKANREKLCKVIQKMRKTLGLSLEKVSKNVVIPVDEIKTFECGQNWDSQKIMHLCHFYQIEYKNILYNLLQNEIQRP